jgi:hypothetical protein
MVVWGQLETEVAGGAHWLEGTKQLVLSDFCERRYMRALGIGALHF